MIKLTVTNEVFKHMKKDSLIYVAGHNGLVGSAIVRELKRQGYNNLIFRDKEEMNLLVQHAVFNFFDEYNPEYVFFAAARVGGIIDNKNHPGNFILENLQMECNVINASREFDVKKLLFLGSSCIYPKMSKQPITEDQLLTGELEPTNDAYAIAKIAGIKMCQSFNKQFGTNFISVMPTNLYGENDNYDLENSHVLPALIRKFHEAKESGAPIVKLWGSGSPKREFLYADDLANACVHLMNNYNDSEIINIGTGEDISIKDVALMIKDIVGYKGALVFDATKPDGTPRKLLDVSKINNLGWKHTTELYEGIEKTYDHFVNGRVRKM